MLRFKIEKRLKKSLARTGVINVSRGSIETPAFVAVGTKATIKSLTPEQLLSTGAQVALGNTYHLYLQPGDQIIKEAGGVHKFMNWNLPMFTDSGGFQAFSLGVAYGEGIGKFIDAEKPEKEILEKGLSDSDKMAKTTEEGIEFKSIIDGSSHFFSPEKSVDIQHNIGADMIFALDDFTSPHAPFEKIKDTIERTERWAKRCLEEHKKKQKDEISLFGIVQGGRFEELRKISATQVSNLDFDGFGIGGTFIKEDMASAVRWVNEILPEEKPRHLLGVGEPLDLFLGVENGCDTFDCVAPTRMARNGALYTKNGRINILNAKYRNDFGKIESSCKCYTCTHYTCAYLTHLFRAKEMLGATLATIHNLYFLNNLMSDIRQAILDDTFFDLKENFFRNYKI